MTRLNAVYKVRYKAMFNDTRRLVLANALDAQLISREDRLPAAFRSLQTFARNKEGHGTGSQCRSDNRNVGHR